MPTTAWTVRRCGDVTLVEVVVRNTGGAGRIRVDNRLDGPVWPPRRRGVPAEGWSTRGYDGIVGDRETIALGYATPAPPEIPPVSVHVRA